jgi:hypothetical protein
VPGDIGIGEQIGLLVEIVVGHEFETERSGMAGV